MSEATAGTQNKELVRRFAAAVNERDFDAFSEIVAADFRRHCPATPTVSVKSRDDLLRFLEQDIRAVPDSTVTIHQLVAEGDRVAFWATYSGTQKGPMGPFPASGNFASEDFAGIFRIAGGRIAELWVTWDNLDMLAQLGHIDPSQPPGT